MLKIKIQENRLDSNSVDFSQELFDLAIEADLRNAEKKTIGGDIYYLVSPEKVSLTLAMQLNALGVDVEGLPLFIDTSVACPFTYTDEEGVEQNYTWDSWKRNNHTFIETTDSKTYLHSSAGTGKPLSIVELTDIGLIANVIDLETLKAKLPVISE